MGALIAGRQVILPKSVREKDKLKESMKEIEEEKIDIIEGLRAQNLFKKEGLDSMEDRDLIHIKIDIEWDLKIDPDREGIKDRMIG